MVAGGGQVERAGRTRCIAGRSLSKRGRIVRMLVQIRAIDDGCGRIFSVRQAGLVTFDVHSKSVLCFETEKRKEELKMKFEINRHRPFALKQFTPSAI